LLLHAARDDRRLQIYGIVALEALQGISLALATTVMTSYLVMSAFAVLVGGFISSRTIVTILSR
jgi:hypothetical protein